MLRASDALMIPFSLMWGGFAIFWEGSVVIGKAPLFFKLWGIPFVLMGFYMMIGRFFADARERSRTSYAVTNERVIIVGGLFKETTKSINLKGLSDISLDEKSDGAGTITLGPASASSWATASGWPGGRQKAPPAFEGIPAARQTYEIIRQAQKTTT